MLFESHDCSSALTCILTLYSYLRLITRILFAPAAGIEVGGTIVATWQVQEVKREKASVCAVLSSYVII